MRIGSIFVETKDGFTCVSDPSVPLDQQKAKFKKLVSTPGLKVKDKAAVQVVMFTSSGFKKRKIKAPKPKKVPEGKVKSLKALAAALEMDEAELKKLRDANTETFPAKDGNFYDVEATKEWLAEVSPDNDQ